MFEIGQVVNKENYTQAAIACNKAGDRHIEERDGQYVIVANASLPEPAAEEQAKVLAVTTLEDRYGLPRATRTALLALQAQGVELDEHLMARVAEVEEAAAPLRANTGSAQDTGTASMEAGDDAGTV